MLLVMTVLLCGVVQFTGVSVSAAGDVVFELDTATLTDKSGNNIALETLGTVLKDSFTNQAGETVSYMTTGQEGDALTNSATAGLLRTTSESITKLKDYTIETWVRYKAPANDNWPKMFKMGNSANQNVFALEMPNNYDKKLVLADDGNPYVIYQNIYKDTWMHVVVTFDTVYSADGTTVEKIVPNMYLNGSDMYSNYGNKPQLTDATKIAMFNAITEFTIGGSTNNGSFGQGFSGDFATFKIYNTVKTQAEADALYKASKDDYVEGTNIGGGDVEIEEGGVILDIDTATLADKSGNNIPVTKLGTITTDSFTNQAGETVTYMTTGQGGDALTNSSTAGFLRTTDANVINQRNLTIEAWMRYKIPGANSWPKMFKFSNTSSNNVFVAEMPAGQKKLVVGNTNNLPMNLDESSVADTWAHYVITLETDCDEDGNITAYYPMVYVNGKDAIGYATRPTFTATDAINAMFEGITELTIGGNSNNGAFSDAFPADFATFKIYKGAKTQTEAAALYEATKGDYLPGLDIEDGGVILDVDPATLTDRSGNNIALSTLGTVTKGSYTNSFGETVSYMTTGQGGDALTNSSTAGFLRTTDANVINQRNLTIETWMRYKIPGANSWPKMFKFSNTSSNNVFVAEMPVGQKKFVLGNTQNIPMYSFGDSDVADKWVHYVITLETDCDENGNITAYYPMMYVNGKDAIGYATRPTVTATDAINAMFEGITELTIGGNSNNGAFSDAFPADFATFKVYKGAMTKEEAAALYENNAGSYDEWNTGARKPSMGEISISLGKDIKEASLDGNVKMEKVIVNNDSTETLISVKGGAYPSVSDASSKAVKIRFGMLDEESTYRLTFDSDIEFTDGTTLGTVKTVDFNTGKAVLIDTEFDDYTNDTLTKDGLSFIGNGVSGSTTGMSIENVTLADASTDKVLRMTPASLNQVNRVIFDLDEKVEKNEALKIEEKARLYRADSGAYNAQVSLSRMLRFVGDTDTQTNLPVPANPDSGVMDYTWGGMGFIDDDSFLNLVSNVTYSQEDNVFYATRKSADGFSMDSCKLGIKNISSVIPIEHYLVEGLGSYTDLSNLKITRGVAPDILNVKYDEAAKTVTVAFNDDMTGINTSSLELYNRASAENDVKVGGTQVSYDAENRIAVIKLFEALADGNYLINVAGATSPVAGSWNGYSEFTVAASTAFTRTVTFKANGVNVAEGAAIPTGTTELSVTVSFNNMPTDDTVVVFAALYDEEDIMLKCTTPETVDAAAAGKTVTIDGITTAEGYVMKVFVWDSMDTIAPEFVVKSIGINN